MEVNNSNASPNDKLYNVVYIDEEGDLIEKTMILDGSKEYSLEDLEHEAV